MGYYDDPCNGISAAGEHAWRPEAGKALFGRIAGFRTENGTHGEILSCVIREGDRLVVVRLSGTSLIGKFLLLDPTAGDGVLIRCRQDGPSIKYDLTVERSASVAELRRNVVNQIPARVLPVASAEARPRVGSLNARS